MLTPSLFAAHIAILVSIVSAAAFGYSIAESHYQDQLLSRGLAIFCPDVGRFAFKGECND